ncbi:MAG: TonB-dependent receptor [Ignavibacteriae bacterium]|nr:TonB-dependent receptor [Ignavibacteriota bacterium]
MLLLLSMIMVGSQTLLSAKLPAKTIVTPENTGTLNGFITDAETKETLISVTVSVKGTKVGALTNKNGFYSLKSIPLGKQTIVVSLLGYKKLEKEIVIEDNDSKKLNFELVPQSIQSKQVYVDAEREVEKRQISVSRVDIPIQQLSQLRIGGEADVFRALQFLPGVLTSSQISSGLYIRGGSPDQNLVLLDGSTVYNPSHLFGFISSFNPDAIKDVELIKGGYPAEYGSRLSAVLNLTQKDGNQEKYEGLASIGLISSRASAQGPIGNGSFFVGGRRTYLDLLLGALPEDKENPLPNFGFYDMNAKITQTIDANNKLFLSGFLSNDFLTLDGSGINFQLGLGNRAASLRWTHVFGDNLFSVINVSGSRYLTGFDGDNSGFKFKVENSIIDYTLKMDLEWFASNDLTIKGGYEGTLFNFNYLQSFGKDSISNSDSTTAGSTNLSIYDHTHSLFTQVNYQLTDLLSLQGGLRFNYWDSSNVTTWDPRIALRYQIQENFAVKAAYGIYHQYLRLASQQDFSFFDTWLPTDNSVLPSTARHYILSFETVPFENYGLNVDFYYKDLSNISELIQTATKGTKVADIFYSGNGRAYGAEIFLQKKVGDLTGWIGYATGFVYATFPDINGGREFRPKYDRRHDFKIVGMYKLNDRWDFSGTFTFQSGQSYTSATSRFGSAMPGESVNYSYVVPGQRYGERLPASHQLNLNANYTTTFFGLPARIMIDIYNVYSRRDIWFRYYNTDKNITTVTDVKLLPIIPTIAFEVKF